MADHGPNHKLRLTRKQKAIVARVRVAEDQWSRYMRARDGGHTDYLKIEEKCNRYYVGDQWEQKDIQKLNSQGRPWLTINFVLDTLNTVLGEQTNKRVEFKYKPSQGGTEHNATIITKIMQSIKDSNRYDYVESKVFADGTIGHGRGFFDIRMKFDNNIRGDIVIRSDDPRNIVIDPDAKEYEPDTWTEVYETRWASVDEVEQTYGRKAADEVRGIGINATRFDPDSVMWEGDTFGDARAKEKTVWVPHSKDEEKSIRLVRIVERQHIKYGPVRRFVDMKSGDTSPVPNTWPEKKVNDFADRFALHIMRRTEKKVRWTVTADRVVLHDEWSPYKTFTKIPYFCYFRRGKPFGICTNLLSPQDQLNKLSSQELHIVNTTANSGYKVEEGALTGMTADELRNKGAETGLVITVAKGRMDGVEKIKPNPIPTGIDRLATKAGGHIRQISGIDGALQGNASPELSGVALEQQAGRGLVKLNVPFDNLDLTRHLVSNKLLELLQQFYTEERVFMITSDGLDFDDETRGEELYINTTNAVGEVINDITGGRYDTTLAMFPARDSFNDAQMAEIVNLRTIGVQIPDDRVVEYSHLAEKAALAEEIRVNEGRGKLSEQQKAQAEFEQRVRQQMMMIEVNKGEAEILLLEAEAMKTAAEAENKDGGVESPEIQAILAAIEAKIMIAREGNQLRRDLANLSATSRLDSDVLSIRGKVITDQNKGSQDRLTEAVKGRNQRKGD